MYVYVRSRREGGAKAHGEMLPRIRIMDISFRSNFRNSRFSRNCSIFHVSFPEI